MENDIWLLRTSVLRAQDGEIFGVAGLGSLGLLAAELASRFHYPRVYTRRHGRYSGLPTVSQKPCLQFRVRMSSRALEFYE